MKRKVDTKASKGRKLRCGGRGREREEGEGAWGGRREGEGGRDVGRGARGVGEVWGRGKGDDMKGVCANFTPRGKVF